MIVLNSFGAPFSKPEGAEAPTLAPFISILRKQSAGILFLFCIIAFTAAFVPVLAADQTVPPYVTGFSSAEEYVDGSLDGQDGWKVDEGEASVANGAVLLHPHEPRTRISRDFSRFEGARTVFLDFRIHGAAGEPPANAPEASSPETFHVALAVEDGFGRLYVFDGNGRGGGVWRAAQSLIPLTEDLRTLAPVALTVRMDFERKTFDLYVDAVLAGFDYGFLYSDQEMFSEFVFRGNPEFPVVLESFSAGVSPAGWENLAGDGVPDWWKRLHSLEIHRDIRDEDAGEEGLTNIEAYFHAVNSQLDEVEQDGRLDGSSAVQLPFFDDFETGSQGNVRTRAGWLASGSGSARVIAGEAVRGERSLLLDAGGREVGVHVDVAENAEEIVWTDLYVEVSKYIRSGPPTVSKGAAAVLYFDGVGRGVAWDGRVGNWRTFDPPVPKKPGWVRVTIRQDFRNQTWSLWLNSVQVAAGLGFASPVSAYNRLAVRQPKTSVRLDGVSIGTSEPPLLDDDGDGLTNEQELVAGTDPQNPDTSGDGMWDGNKILWGFDPLERQNFARFAPDADGVLAWSSEFRPEDGFSAGRLDSQRGWIAGPGVRVSRKEAAGREEELLIPSVSLGHEPEAAIRYFGMGGEETVWLTMRIRPQPGLLPNVEDMEDPTSAIFAVNASGHLFAYDGESRRWVNSHIRFDSAESRRIDIMLDYRTGRYWLCIDRVLVLRDLGFRDLGMRTLTRMALRGSVGEEVRSTGIGEVRASVGEPAGMDFSGDGLTNDEKRALGLDIFRVDTTGDGIPDWWLVQYGFDATDPEIGNTDTGYGLTVREAWLLGTDPTEMDTDGDGWSDFEEYLAGTDPLDSESAPIRSAAEDWTVSRVGDGLPPHAFHVDGEYRLLGTGRGTERHADGFTFVYRKISGNFEAIARIRAPVHLPGGPDSPPSWLSQNGLMARPSLDMADPYAALFSSPYWYWSRFRELPGARAMGMTHEPVIAGGSKYVRMVRIGNRFRHYLSSDGETWLLAAEVAVSMPEEILVGMFASAHSGSRWVRAGLEDVSVASLADQEEWHQHDWEGATVFNSFAWMGEWDGGSDYDGTMLALRRPVLDELHEAGFSAPIVREIPAAEAVQTVGKWQRQGATLTSLERRGWVEFDLEVTEPDVYLIELEAQENNKRRTSLALFDLKFYLEEEYLGTRVLEATAEESGAVYVFTPWLESGTHRLRVFWDGARSWSFLQINGVRLRAINGADTSGSGVKDWVEQRIAQQSAMDPQPQLFTHVSPLPLEGRDRFNSRMQIENRVLIENVPDGRNFLRPFPEHPRGATGADFRAARGALVEAETPARVPGEGHLLPGAPAEWEHYLSAWSQGSSVRPNKGAGHRFWADVHLAPLADNAITVSWQDGVMEQRHLARWIPYNLLQGGSMVLRVGDSIMVTVHQGDPQSGQVFLDVEGETFETVPDAPLIYTFSEPGDYLLRGTYRSESGQEVSGALNVVAREYSFPPRPLAYVGRERVWDTEGNSDGGASPVFEADPRLSMRISDREARDLHFSSNNNILKTIAARIPESGAILDSVDVESFRLFSSWETYATVVDTFPDGSKLVEMMMVVSPLPEDIRIFKEIFVGGILFDDGTIERWILPEDFDEHGQVTFRFIMPEDATSSACHRTHVFQGDVRIGIR